MKGKKGIVCQDTIFEKRQHLFYEKQTNSHAVAIKQLGGNKSVIITGTDFFFLQNYNFIHFT